MKRVCVFAGSSRGTRPEYRELAEDLGRALAQRQLGLVYGGACVGLMGAMADAALAEGGQVIGVIPDALVAKEVAHTGLSEIHVVTSMHERKAMMTGLADAFVALPGGWGTLDELFEVLTWSQLGLHQKACGLLNILGYFDPLLSFLQRSVDDGFVSREHMAMIAVESSPAGLLDRLAAHRPRVVPKWIHRASV